MVSFRVVDGTLAGNVLAAADVRARIGQQVDDLAALVALDLFRLDYLALQVVLSSVGHVFDHGDQLLTRVVHRDDSLVRLQVPQRRILADLVLGPLRDLPSL